MGDNSKMTERQSNGILIDGDNGCHYQGQKKQEGKDTTNSNSLKFEEANSSSDSFEIDGKAKAAESSDSSECQENSSAEIKERPVWDNKFQYIMAALGFAVGLGNIWRFPYLCQKNGGGAFLIPYFLMLVLEGYPLYFLELAMGQSIRKGAVGVWSSVDPHLVGVGFASIVVSLLIGLYYNMILAWALFYLFNSFRAKLPWSECPFENVTEVTECIATSPTDYFWYRQTLDISDSIESGATLNWKMVVSLFVAWVLVFFGIMKGIKSSGKVMYFATIFPYVILIAFFIRGMTLEGAAAGVAHMFRPDVSKLKDPVVWREAATQIFFSLGLGYGAIIAYSSYNPPKNDCKKDALFVVTANSMTSVFACITVFSVLGFKAHHATENCKTKNQEIVSSKASVNLLNITYDDFLLEVQELNASKPDLFTNIFITNWKCSIETELSEIGQGTGLAFIAFAETILELPCAPLWAVLFFIMLLCIGMSSEFGILQAFITMVLDSPCKVTKLKLTGVLCFVLFVLGLIFTMRSGSYFLEIFDGYSATFGLVAIALCETIGASWVYGLESLSSDINNMIGSRPGWYWQISWKYTCPLAMITVLVASLLDLCINTPYYLVWRPFVEGSKVKLSYPPWAVFIIVVLILSSILCIPIFALLVHYGKFQSKLVGSNPSGKNRRSEFRDEIGPSDSAIPLTTKYQV